VLEEGRIGSPSLELDRLLGRGGVWWWRIERRRRGKRGKGRRR